jgi:uncharacterized protein
LADIVLAFITGLTTGGLSCLAVQGGLLASSLAGQIEKDLQVPASKSRKGKPVAVVNQVRPARPILVFLIAKLAAYTLLGFLLGLVGQMFQLSAYARAFLQIAIGFFMLGTALRLLNVHPIFRYFAFEPPASLRRLLRKKAAAGSESALFTPALLGFLTVLIPCGIAQAMMAVALGTGDPLQGAALMFAFTLGTSPVFFGVAYFATHLGARLEKYFMRFVAAAILILAVVTIDSGLTLAGSPVSLSHFTSSLFSPASDVAAAPASGESESGKSQDIVTVSVQNSGYSPDVVHAKAGVPVKLRLVSKNVFSCSRAFTIPSLGVEKLLKATGEAVIELPAQKKGTQIPFSCSMGMYSGTIIFDL